MGTGTQSGKMALRKSQRSTRIEREAQAAEYEVTGRGEISDARAARLALLRSIDRDIEVTRLAQPEGGKIVEEVKAVRDPA